RPSTATRFSDEAIDISFGRDPEPPRPGRAVTLQRLERARLAVRAVDTEHLPEELALVPPLVLCRALEVSCRTPWNGACQDPRRSLDAHVIRSITQEERARLDGAGTVLATCYKRRPRRLPKRSGRA